MNKRRLTLTAALLLLVVAAATPGCRIFSFSGCTRNGFAPGATVRVREQIFHTGCQTLGCPRINSYEVRADSTGTIRYNRDEDGMCWPNSTKLDFTTVRIPLPTFSATSGPINLQAPPPSVTIAGSGIDTTYGAPIMFLYDYNYTFVGSQTAQSYDGSTWANFALPALPNPYSGTYTAKLAVMQWDGTYIEVGEAYVDCYGIPRTDNDGDGVYCDQDCDDWDWRISPWNSPDCSGYLWDANCNGQYDPFEYECQPQPGGECCGPGCYCY